MEQVVLGKIVAPHGVRGDLRIMPLTSNLQLFIMEMGYLLLPDGKRLTVKQARPHKNVIIVTAEEITSIEAVEALRGRKVSVYRKDMPELPEGRYYVGIAPPEGKDILVANIPENIREIDLPGKRIVVRLPEWDDEDIR